MKNCTDFKDFHILPFSINNGGKTVVFTVFATAYFIGIVMNVSIITLICTDYRLHTPMYIFLSNLSLVDFCYTTVIVPKLVAMLLSGISSVTFTQCFTQMYFFYFLASVENLLLVLMAYDRGVAICSPLHYINILNKKKCFMLIIVIFVTASLNSLLITLPNKKLHFCNSNTLQHFFCESKAMTKIATSGAEFIYRVFYIELFSFGLVPCLCSFVSYVKILKVIFDIKSSEGRRKAFSTCSSHLTVISLYFGTAALMILMPPSKYSDLLDQVFTMLFSVIIPMLNPLIYSLRNKDVHGAVLRLVGGKVKPIIVFTRPKAAKAYDKLSKQF